MSTLTIASLFAPLVSGMATGLVVPYFMAKNSKTRKLTKQLREARLVLERHYEESAKFLADPEAPEVLCSILLNMSDAINDGRAVSAFLRNRKMVDQPKADTRHIVEEVEKLRPFRPDLALAFDRGMGFGVAAMLLRWGEKSEASAASIVSIMSDRYAEIDFVSTTIGNRKLSGLRPALAAA